MNNISKEKRKEAIKMHNGKHKFGCEDDDFKVEGQDEEEIVRITKSHSKDMHGMDITDDEARAKVQVL